MDEGLRACKTVDDVVEYVSHYCEDANYHSIDFLSHWKSVRKYIVKPNRLRACKALGQSIMDTI